MLNILVVNENFTGGGLETHIHSYYMELREKHHFVFAFGKYKSKLEFNDEDIHTGFHFGWCCSIGEFIDDVERLIHLIHHEKIDVVHAHPFHSIFPAVIAGQLTGIPVVCTHHGAYSFAFPGGVNEALLLYYAYTELVSCVFSVSQSGKQALEERVHVPNVEFMPNAIDPRVYQHHKVVNNRRWAAISRLDGDLGKVSALKKFFKIMPHIPIDNVDIYGDGSQRHILEEYVKELNLLDKVRFMGFQSDLYKRLDGNYNGIIGSDRVALEGLTMGYPVLEVGYDQICGILYGEVLQRAKTCNFVANTLPELNSDEITFQLEQVYTHPEQFDFRQEMIDTFDIRSIARDYEKRLSTLDFSPHANIITWFEDVKICPDSQANFYASQDIFQMLKRHIEPYAIDRNIKDLFILTGNFEGVNGEVNRLRTALSGQMQHLERTQTQIGNLQNEKGLLQAQLSSLEEAQRQLQAQLFDLREAHEQLYIRLQTLTQLLGQLREQTEYHRKILAPLIWIRKLLSRIKWKIKSGLR